MLADAAAAVPPGGRDRRDRQLPGTLDDRARRGGARRSTSSRSIPHAGNDRGPGGDRRVRRRGRGRPGGVRAPTWNGPVSRDRVRHVPAFSADAHGDVDGPIDVLYVDGAHRYRAGPGRRPRLGRAGGGRRRAADPRRVLVDRRHRWRSAASCVFGRPLPLRRALAIAGVVPRRPPAGSASPGLRNAGRQLAQLGWFARNVAVKVLLTARLRTAAPPPRPPGPGVAVLDGRTRSPIAPSTLSGLGPARCRVAATLAARRIRRRRGSASPAVRGRSAAAPSPAASAARYGDSAQNGGGTVIAPDRADAREVVLDDGAGTVTVAAGVSLDELLRVLVPRGWFVPVTPGTRFVTVGGAIASDIHGKNHHVDGSFGRHVRAAGAAARRRRGRRRSVPTAWPELFWATVGGMGLTGIILDATIRLLPIETSRCSVDTDRASATSTPAGGDGGRRRPATATRWRGSTSIARGAAPRAQRADPGRARPPRRAVAATGRSTRWRTTPSRLVERAAGRPARRRAQPRHDQGVQRAAGSARRRAGGSARCSRSPASSTRSTWSARGTACTAARGFVAVPVRCVPFGAEDALRAVVGAPRGVGRGRASSPCSSASARRTRRRCSFPAPGWTLAARRPGRARLAWAGCCHGLDELVLGAGGRHYLAKDSAHDADAIRRGYPRLDEWQARARRGRPAWPCG